MAFAGIIIWQFSRTIDFTCTEDYSTAISMLICGIHFLAYGRPFALALATSVAIILIVPIYLLSPSLLREAEILTAIITLTSICVGFMVFGHGE